MRGAARHRPVEELMSRTPLTVYICTHKDCTRAWRHLCDNSPGKWLKRQVEAAGLPYKLHIIKTDCMDRCDEAACVCFVSGDRASTQVYVRGDEDVHRLLAAARDVAGDGWGEPSPGLRVIKES
jgi:predicted metal-binding protein